MSLANDDLNGVYYLAVRQFYAFTTRALIDLRARRGEEDENTVSNELIIIARHHSCDGFIHCLPLSLLT